MRIRPVELEQAAKDRNIRLPQLQENCGKKIEEIREALHDIRKISRQFDLDVSEARSQIKDTVEKLKSLYLKRLDEAQKATEEELNTIEEKRVETIKAIENQLTSLMSRTATADTITNLLKDSGSELEVASDYQRVESVLQDVVAAEPSSIINAEHSLTADVKFEETVEQNVYQIAIGRVSSRSTRPKVELNNDDPVSKMEFGNVGNEKLSSAFDVALTPTGDIAVTDYRRAKVNIFNSTGVFKSAFNVGIDVGQTSNPFCIQVGPDNLFYVTDSSPYVKIFDLQGTYKRSFHTVSPDNVAYYTRGSSKVCGLAINSKNQVLAGNITHNFISCHSLDGTHLRSINVSIHPQFLAVTSKGSIVVTPFINGTEAHIIDESGNLLTKLEKPSEVLSWKPCGVAVSRCFKDKDEGDEMFVVDFDNGYAIYRYSSSGKYVDCVIKKNLSCPRSLALSTDEKLLYVTNNKSVKLFEI